MRNQLNLIAAAIFAATQAQAATATFGWEDGSTVLGQYNASHIVHNNVSVQARTGDFSLLVEDADPIDNGTPQSFLAWVNDLTDGDQVTVSFWVYDDAADRPAGRIWGHYTDDPTDIDAYAGSAGGNSTYTDGSGWQELSHTWTFDSSDNSRDGLVVEFRLYDSSSFTTGSLFIDDITITTSAGVITLPSGEQIGDDGDSDGGDTGGDPGTGDALFISEYVEGSSNNKALEFYNPSAAPVDFSGAGYTLSRFSNGSNTGSNITLSGTVAANDVFVIANSNAAAEILAVADQTTGSISHNGDDAYVLYKNGVVVDSFGQVGVDPGSSWGSGDVTTANNTLRRTSASDTVIDDAFDPATQWQGFGNNEFSDLGLYNGDGGGDPSDPSDPSDPGTITCGADYTPIHAIQGSGSATPLTGVVEVEGVVTADLQAGVDGFYMQTAPTEDDGDAATSEGIFVYTGNNPQTVTQGDRVRLKASVGEFYDMTQLSNVTDLQVCASEQDMPAITAIQLPFDSATAPEALEGMQVSFTDLTVNDTYDLGRFGQVTLANGRRMIPTQVARPGAEAEAIAALNQLNAISLDDGSNEQNPAVIPFPAPGLSATNSLRVGDTATLGAGVLHYSFGSYRVYPLEQVTFSSANPRVDAPVLTGEGNLNIASFNVLNYFTTLNERGANSNQELIRQRDKIVAAIVALDAEIVGLMEIENNGFGDSSAIADLVTALNQADSAANWQYITPTVNNIGSDQITVGLIYRSAEVAPVGVAKILDSSNSIVDDNGDPLFLDTKNRPALAQEFELLSNGETVVVAVNHFKSKGSSCDSIGDPDVGDGQANCNITRTRAAQAVSAWLNAEYVGKPVLTIGDLNAYAKEDPLMAFADNGHLELFEVMDKQDAYSYIFFGESGQLDHALGNSVLVSKLVDITEWHINTDEPRVLDYNTEFKTDEQIASLYAADPYRSSDHDPVIVTLELIPAADPNLTEIDVEAVENLTEADIAKFQVKVDKWQGLIAKWQAGIEKLEADIADLDPQEDAEKIAKKQGRIVQKQAKSAIYQDLSEVALTAIGINAPATHNIARQLLLSDNNAEKLLLKQARFEQRSNADQAVKLEAEAIGLQAAGKLEEAENKRQTALKIRASAGVFKVLAEVLAAAI